jgi:hypothetical protein
MMEMENEELKLIGLNPEWSNGLCAKIFEKLNGLLRRFIYFEDPSYYPLSALYVLLTHFYPIFDEVPYLLITGLFDSGKSRLGDIFEGTSLNPTNSSDYTPASLYRTIEDKGALTLIIDEAEELSYLKRAILLSILRSGYRRNGKVVRCDKGEPIEFPTFCPKIIINQRGLIDPALESRTIPVPMIRSQNHLETFRFATVGPEFREAKNLIRLFVQGYGDIIFRRYISFKGVDGLTNRDLEVWTPIIIIAEILDSAIPDSSIRSQMLELARRIILQRRRRQLIENRDAQILEATRAFVEATSPIPKDGKDFYVGEQLSKSIKDRWGIPNLKIEQVSRTLSNHNILRDIQRIRLDINDRGSISKTQKTCYELDKGRLTELTRDYFE